MTKDLILVLSVSLFGFLTTLAVMPLVKRIAKKKGIMAHPGGRRNHERPTPLLGGLAIYLPFALVFCFLYAGVLIGQFPITHPDSLQMLSLFLGSAWILFLGFIDDKQRLGWRRKLVGEVFGISILVLGGHSVSVATVPFLGPVQFGWFGIPLFALAILVVTNAINLIDGLDGLAGGICFFAAVTCGAIGLWRGDLFSAVVAFSISGSLLGFLWFNFPPATIYMGDGGSLTLGFLLGTLAVSNSASFPGQRSATLGMLAISFLPFGVALLDVILAVFRRWVTGRKIFMPDSDHIHHRLMEKFREPRRVVAIFYFFSGLLSIMTISLVLGPQSEFHKAFIAICGLFLLGVLVAVLRLYRVESIAQVIQNRPHFQFVTTYRSFMSARIFRADSFDDLISLLESGVRDLDYDCVEVISQGSTIRYWANSRRIHPDSPRIHEELSFEPATLTIKWIVPTHHSETYQKFLRITWYACVRELGDKIATLATAQAPTFGEAENFLLASDMSTLDRH